MGRLVKMSAVALALLVPATAAQAGSKSMKESVVFKVYLDGVDKYGCLTPCGGECACFYACLNTCTGCFTGSACGCVANCSCKGPLCFKCVNFFCDPCWCICVKSSLYTVCKGGKCTYTACGTAKCCNSGSSGGPA